MLLRVSSSVLEQVNFKSGKNVDTCRDSEIRRKNLNNLFSVLASSVFHFSCVALERIRL